MSFYKINSYDMNNYITLVPFKGIKYNLNDNWDSYFIMIQIFSFVKLNCSIVQS